MIRSKPVVFIVWVFSKNNHGPLHKLSFALKRAKDNTRAAALQRLHVGIGPAAARTWHTTTVGLLTGHNMATVAARPKAITHAESMPPVSLIKPACMRVWWALYVAQETKQRAHPECQHEILILPCSMWQTAPEHLLLHDCHSYECPAAERQFASCQGQHTGQGNPKQPRCHWHAYTAHTAHHAHTRLMECPIP